MATPHVCLLAPVSSEIAFKSQDVGDKQAPSPRGRASNQTIVGSRVSGLSRGDERGPSGWGPRPSLWSGLGGSQPGDFRISVLRRIARRGMWASAWGAIAAAFRRVLSENELPTGENDDDVHRAASPSSLGGGGGDGVASSIWLEEPCLESAAASKSAPQPARSQPSARFGTAQI